MELRAWRDAQIRNSLASTGFLTDARAQARAASQAGPLAQRLPRSWPLAATFFYSMGSEKSGASKVSDFMWLP